MILFRGRADADADWNENSYMKALNFHEHVTGAADGWVKAERAKALNFIRQSVAIKSKWADARFPLEIACCASQPSFMPSNPAAVFT